MADTQTQQQQDQARRRQALLLAAVTAQASAMDAITAALLLLIGNLWRAVSNPYDHRQVDTFVHSAGQVAQSARRQAAGIADAYMRTVLTAMDVPLTGTPEPIPALPRGIPLTEEWVRPVKEYRRARLLGVAELEALQQAERRAKVIGAMDLAVAQRDAVARRLVVASDVTGWRRVVHPELSRGGTCGLCLAAADRVYHTSELMPLHGRCKCTVAPVTATADPGSPLNRDSLNALYREAGGTGRAQLARARFKVEQHGELGPVLVNEADSFRGPAVVAADSARLAEQARSEVAALESTLEDLRQRAAAGEDVSGPLAWQQDRLDVLREMAAA